LLTPPQLSQDAMTLVLKNGVVLTVRYAAADAYSLRWRTSLHTDDVEIGIDTAPTHPAAGNDAEPPAPCRWQRGGRSR
jgi:hypothetical protein